MTTLSSLFAKNHHGEKGFVPLFYPITDYDFEWHHMAKNSPYVIPVPKEMHREIAGVREDHYDTVNGKFLVWIGREGLNHVTKASFGEDVKSKSIEKIEKQEKLKPRRFK